MDERLQLGQRGPNRIDPRSQGALLVLGPLPSSLLSKAEPPDDQWQERALAQQGGEDHAQGEKQHRIAFWKRLAARNRQRDRERSRQRDHAADAREGDHERRSPRQSGLAETDCTRHPARKIGHGVDPDEPGHDDNEADERAMQHQPLPRDVAETFYDGPGLQSGEQEEQGFREVDDQAPKEEAVQARAGGDKAWPLPAHVEARRNAAKGVSKDSVISTMGSRMPRRSRSMAQPTSTPYNVSPMTIRTNAPTACPIDKPPV